MLLSVTVVLIRPYFDVVTYGSSMF
uniref:Uncharacterized protein n=1 Tax=Rhizophora mucronata TaxID=61149 RepID=A0A2P2QY05_RHIMU